MNELKTFENPELGAIRTVEINGEPWMVGKDVALALGYSNPRDALSKHVDSDDKGGSQIATPYGVQEMTIINESGLYSLVLSSKLPSAKKFRRWVTSEVLPSIRKTGGYNLPKDYPSALRALADSEEKRLALAAENEAQRQAIADFQPTKQYSANIGH
ncbi:MAG: Bro-N domain-containing protein [Oscillospiraceae bacterium]|nr:Bro-N domain-containing protein [Oscillospiraceae bacterium]